MSTRIKMQSPQTEVDVQSGTPSKTKSKNLVEWNVDMRVTVSNVTRSKLLQKSRNLVVFVLAILFAIALSHIKREVRALQVQMHCVNVNLLALMSKYDRLNRSLNRAWFQRPNTFSNEASFKAFERISSTGRIPEVHENAGDNRSGVIRANSYGYEEITVAPVANVELEVKRLIEIDEDVGNKTNRSKSSRAIEPLANADKIVDHSKSGNVLRIERAILTFEKRNSTALENEEIDEDSGLDSWREPRAGRSRRDEGRGKKRRKNKRRPKRSRRRLGPLVATFVGAIPEQHVTDAVYIGPWVKSTKNDSQYSLNKFHLVEDKKSIEVTTTGLYMISVQIFYFGESTNYSYWIMLNSEGASQSQKLVKCATGSAVSAAEVSCHTSIITLLRRGDRLHVQQQERNRLINMREGHSYIQLVLLSNNVYKRRAT